MDFRVVCTNIAIPTYYKCTESCKIWYRYETRQHHLDDIWYAHFLYRRNWWIYAIREEQYLLLQWDVRLMSRDLNITSNPFKILQQMGWITKIKYIYIFLVQVPAIVGMWGIPKSFCEYIDTHKCALYTLDGTWKICIRYETYQHHLNGILCSPFLCYVFFKLQSCIMLNLYSKYSRN